MDFEDLLQRANNRNVIITSMDTSEVMDISERQTTSSHVETHESPVLNDKEQDKSTTNPNESNNTMETSRLSSVSAVSVTATSVTTTVPTGLKNRLSLLAQNLDAFEDGMKPAQRSKEDYIRGPIRRPDNNQQADPNEFFGIAGSPSGNNSFQSVHSSTPRGGINDSAGAVNVSPVVKSGSPAVKTTPVAANQDVDMDSSLAGVFSFAKADPSKRRMQSIIESKENISNHSASKSVSFEASPVTGSLKKVSDLRKQFDRPEFGRLVENAVDHNHINFASSRRKFEHQCLAEKSTNIQTPITAKQFRGITSVRVYDKPAPVQRANAEIIHGPQFSDAANFWKKLDKAGDSDDLLDAALCMAGEHARVPAPQPQSVRFAVPKPAPRHQLHMSWERLAKNDEENAVAMVIEEDDVAENESANRSESVSPSIPSDSFQFVPSTPKPVAVGTDDFKEDVMSLNRSFCEVPKSSLLDEVNQSFAKNFTPTRQATVANKENSSRPHLVHTLSAYRRNNSSPYVKPQEPEEEEELKPIQPIIHVFTNEERQNFVIKLNQHMSILRQQATQAYSGIKKSRMQKFDMALDAELVRTATVKELEILAAKQEIARFEDDHTLSVHLPRATLTLSDMAVSLTGVGPLRENRYEFVMLVVRHKNFVRSTQCYCVNKLLRNGSSGLKWDTSIKIPNVSPDFVVSIDVYLLTYDFPANKSKAAKKSLFQLMSSREVRLPDQFEAIGHMTIHKNDLQEEYHTLQSTRPPIGNFIRFRALVNVTDPDEATWSGNVSIYRVVSEKGSWELYYGRLLNARMKFWTSREHVDVKEHALCLNMCDITEPVHPFADDRIGFQFDFAVSLKDREDKEVRLMLSCSSSKDRNAVINALNESYEHTKAWNGVRLTHCV